MTEKKINSVDITIVLDRSGSMQAIQQDTIGGFNSFLEAQSRLENETNITLVEFNDYIRRVYTATPIKRAPRLSVENFTPLGSTALLDAMGETIDATGARLRDKAESERPNIVIFAVITDGQENASRRFTRQRVFDMISHQKHKYNWDFVFLGANQDAIQAGQYYGFDYGKTMSFAANTAGTNDAFRSLSTYTATASAAASPIVLMNTAFSVDDRDKQTAAGAVAPINTTGTTGNNV